MSNLNMNNLKSKKLTMKKLIKGMALTSMAMAGGALFAEIAWAKFDIDAGVAAGFNPLLAGVEAHWGKGLLLTGITAAIWGEGDGRQRAQRAGISTGVAAGVVLALIAGLK